jgi:hypothetical protein
LGICLDVVVVVVVVVVVRMVLFSLVSAHLVLQWALYIEGVPYTLLLFVIIR